MCRAWLKKRTRGPPTRKPARGQTPTFVGEHGRLVLDGGTDTGSPFLVFVEIDLYPVRSALIATRVDSERRPIQPIVRECSVASSSDLAVLPTQKRPFREEACRREHATCATTTRCASDIAARLLRPSSRSVAVRCRIARHITLIQDLDLIIDKFTHIKPSFPICTLEASCLEQPIHCCRQQQ